MLGAKAKARRARGEVRGKAEVLIQQVQTYDRLLGQPISSPEQLQRQSLVELGALVRALEEKLSASLRGPREDVK